MRLGGLSTGPVAKDRLESLKSETHCRRVKVFRFRASMIRWALLFKDSISGTEESAKVSNFTNCRCMHKSKEQPLAAVREEVAELLTLNKFRSRCERGRFTQLMLLPGGLATPIPRLSEARPR